MLLSYLDTLLESTTPIATTPRRRKIKGLGWTPDLPDQRDFMYKIRVMPGRILPPKVDLRAQYGLTASNYAVYDQGELGSCVANAVGAAMQFEMLRQKEQELFTPSRLFIYYNARVLLGTPDEDSGATIRDGIKSVVDQGCPPESEYPYDIVKFRDKPADYCYSHALHHQALLYQRLGNWSESMMKNCLASGFPFTFGFACYESFFSQQVADTGIVPMPLGNEQLVGGHAVLAIGYDDATSRFLVRNSWGTEWGVDGYFTIPYSYLTNPNLADDFWTIHLVE